MYKWYNSLKIKAFYWLSQNLHKITLNIIYIYHKWIYKDVPLACKIWLKSTKYFNLLLEMVDILTKLRPCFCNLLCNCRKTSLDFNANWHRVNLNVVLPSCKGFFNILVKCVTCCAFLHFCKRLNFFRKLLALQKPLRILIKICSSCVQDGIIFGVSKKF